MPRHLIGWSVWLLVLIVLISLGFDVYWTGKSSAPETSAPTPAAIAETQPNGNTQTQAGNQVPATPLTSTGSITSLGNSTVSTETLTALEASPVLGQPVATDASDAPLLVQAPGTINIMLLGMDAQGNADRRYARTDTIMVASVNP